MQGYLVLRTLGGEDRWIQQNSNKHNGKLKKHIHAFMASILKDRQNRLSRFASKSMPQML